LQVLDVTVISTTQASVAGAPVIEKLLPAVEVVFDAVKKLVEEDSRRALISMVTPEGGIVDVILTVNGKSGPGAGGSVVPVAGVVVTASVVSELQPSDFFFLQYGIATRISTADIQLRTVFFIVFVLTLI
jgi:hypothetical protein